MVDSSPSRLRVVIIVSFHITTALLVTLLNKAVLNILPIPSLLLLCQSIIALVLMYLGIATGYYTLPDFDSKLLREISPILGMKIIAQLSKTYCLLNVNASFYQIARGLLLPFTVMLSCVFLTSSRPNRSVLVACGVTTLGFVWGIEGEAIGQTSSAGIAWGVSSSLITALETVVVKSLAGKVKVLDLVFLTSVTTIPVYAIMAFLTGDLGLVSKLAISDDTTTHLIRAIVIAGIFNFALSVAAYLQITVTSPITHTISTSVRGVMQSLLAVAFLEHESLTGSRMISIGVILAGTLAYTYAKEMEKRKQISIAALAAVTLPRYSEKATEDFPRDETQHSS